MYDQHSKGISYTAGFFILIGFTIAALLLAGLISLPVWTGMTGLSATSMEENMTNPAYSDAIKIIQTITIITGFLLPAIIAAALLSRKPMKLLGFRGRVTLKQSALVVLIVFFSLLVSSSLAYLNEMIPLTENLKKIFDRWENEYNNQIEVIIGLNNPIQFIMGILVMGFLPALCEETLFRGGLQNFLTRATNRPWLSMVIVSIIFSMAHFSYYGFLSRFFLGLMLGLLFHLSGRLWLSILAHFLNNAAAITVIYIYTLQGKPLKEAITESEGTAWGILALPVVIGLFMRFYHMSKNNKDELQAEIPARNDPGDLFC